MGEENGGDDLARLRLDNWRRRLIDLSYRNRLVKFRPTRATTLMVESPSIHTRLGEPDRTRPWRFHPPPELETDQKDGESVFFVDDEETVINPSLTEKLRYDAGLDIPEDWSWEDKPLEEELAEIRAAIAGTGWEIREEAVLGLFSFQMYVMFRDLLDNEEVILKHPIIRAFAGDASEFEATFKEIKLPQIEDLDQFSNPPRRTRSSMLMRPSASASRPRSTANRSLCMGHRGRASSQTIANIIAESVACQYRPGRPREGRPPGKGSEHGDKAKEAQEGQAKAKPTAKPLTPEQRSARARAQATRVGRSKPKLGMLGGATQQTGKACGRADRRYKKGGR